MENSETQTQNIETQTGNMADQINALNGLVPGYFDENNFLSQKNYGTNQNLPAEYKDPKILFDVANRKIGDKNFGFIETGQGYQLNFGNNIFPIVCESPRQLLSLLALTNYAVNRLKNEGDLVHGRGILASPGTRYFLHGREYDSAKTFMPYDYLTAIFTKDEKLTWSSDPKSGANLGKSVEENYYTQFQNFVQKIVDYQKS